MVCVWQHWKGEKLEEYGMSMATLERVKNLGIWHVYDSVGEGKNWRNVMFYGKTGEEKTWGNTVYVWQRWKGRKLEEYGICLATLGRGKAGGIWYVYGNVGGGENWRNTLCIWQR